VAQLTHREYEALERAVVDGARIAVYRRGTEYVVVPRALRVRAGREAIEATNPTTGDEIVLYVDELDDIQVVR
jgi:hypothetical protein